MDQQPETSGDLARRIDAGARFSSGIVVSGARVLFDAIKKSGYGREPGLSASGIHEHQGAVDRSGVFRNE